MGYRSLIALTVLAAVGAIAHKMTFSHSIALIAAAAAISVGCNAMRIASILAVALFAPDFAYGFWHDLAGYLSFIVAMTILFRIENLLADRQAANNEALP